MSLILTDSTLIGLFYIQRYRYLTITQFAYITETTYDNAGHTLRILERKKIIGSFGNIVQGAGRVPKVCYLTRKGHGFLIEHMEDLQDVIGGYKKVNTDTKWTAKMPHTLALIDCFLAVEHQVKDTQKYRLIDVFTENKKEKFEGKIRTETGDFIDDSGTSEGRIIPDGTFILEQIETGKRFLFFVEYDNGTESLQTKMPANYHKTVQYKFSQYVRYLESGRYAKKYRALGEFKFFFMLFVTNSPRRAGNISDSLAFIKPELRRLFYISDIESALEDFFFSSWQKPAGQESDKRPIVSK